MLGLRGGIVVLRWSEINLRERTATVERALSGNTVGPPARDAAGAPVFTFHGLRHTVASLFIRKMDPVEVKAIMGHASIKTTERYLHARRASGPVDKVTDALSQDSFSDEARLAQEILHLDPDARDRLLEPIAAG